MKKIIVLAVFSFLFVVGCKGPQGEVGPQGATGLQGEKGATGAAGTNGTNGTTGATGPAGTANVFYSKWEKINLYYKISTTTVQASVIMNNSVQESQMNKFYNPETDLILVYGASCCGDYYVLPCENIVNTIKKITVSYKTDFFISRTSLTPFLTQLYIIKHFSTNAPTVELPTFYRWVIIKGGNPLGRKANIDYSDYKAVKKAYNIPD